MNEVTVIVALGLLALVVISVLILLWRSPAGAFDDFDESERNVLSAAEEWVECPRDTVAHIFGSHDRTFVQSQGSDRLLRAFERDRRQIALQWAWGSFEETQRLHVPALPGLSQQQRPQRPARNQAHRRIPAAPRHVLDAGGRDPGGRAKWPRAAGGRGRQFAPAVHRRDHRSYGARKRKFHEGLRPSNS